METIDSGEIDIDIEIEGELRLRDLQADGETNTAGLGKTELDWKGTELSRLGEPEWDETFRLVPPVDSCTLTDSA